MTTPATPRTALVLGGGGITGIAWEIGLLAGLAEAGLDLSTADLVVGTSAGSVVGALLTSGRPPAELLERQLGPVGHERAASTGPRVLLGLGWALLRSRGDAAGFRRRAGRFALGASTPSEAERLEVIGERLRGVDWPERDLRVTAVDARSGEPVVWQRSSGVGLVEAVASSCAVPGVYPPVTIGERRYVDGGMRSVANVDLAAGHDRVVVLAPLARGMGVLRSPADQLAELGADRGVVVSPDGDSRAAIGRNVLDPAARAPSARAGRAQAATELDRVAAVWR
ncbi:patatin-like phospholipase family protein [Rhodococcus aerolatus]